LPGRSSIAATARASILDTMKRRLILGQMQSSPAERL
jgi:hypothetical protein